MKAITLRSGKELKSQTEAPKEAEGKEDEQDEMVEDVLKEEQASEKIEQKKASDSIPSAYEQKIPFSQRLKKQKDKEQFFKFLKNFKKLQINIPPAEALIQDA